jgi:hypothetical protein
MITVSKATIAPARPPVNAPPYEVSVAHDMSG